MADLTGKNISDTYARLVQVSESQLYDGGGSILPIQFNGNDVIIPGALRAESYIVSQSTTVATSGSTIFGDSYDDTHKFSGSVNIGSRVNTGYNTVTPVLYVKQDGVTQGSVANGFGGAIDFHTSRGDTPSTNGSRTARISSRITHGANTSNDYYAMDLGIRSNDTQIDVITLHSDNTNTTGRVGILDTTPSYTLDVNGTFRTTGGALLGDAPTDTHAVNGTFLVNHGATFSSTMTASNISSSGHVSASAINTPTLTGVGDTIALEVAGYISGSEFRTTGHISASGNIKADGYISGSEFRTTGHITASGNIKADGYISSSGFVYGSQFRSHDRIVGVYHTGTSVLRLGDSGERTRIYGTAINLDAPVTASGNIEAATYISASEFRTTGHITASGNISSSGTSSAGSLIVTNQNLGISLTGYQSTIQFSGTAGGWLEGIMYKASDGNVRYGLLFPGSDVVALSNRAANGVVQIRANDGDIGSGGEHIVAKFEDDKVNIGNAIYLASGSGHITASGDISSSGNIYSATEECIQFSFQSDNDSEGWFGPNKQGPTYYFWNWDYGDDTAVQTIDWSTGHHERILNGGYRVPYKIEVTRFGVSGYNSQTGTAVMTCSLLVGSPEQAAPGNSSIPLNQAGTFISNTAESRYGVMTGSLAFSGGTQLLVSESQYIYPRIKCPNTDQDVNGTWTIYYRRVK